MADLTQLSDDELEAELRARLVAPSKPTPTDHSAARGFVLGGAEMGYNALDHFNNGLDAVGLGRVDSLDRASAKYRQQLANNSSMGGQTAGRFGAAVASGSTTRAPAAVIGGIQGALSSPERNALGVAEDALWGAGGAFVGEKAIQGLGKLVSPVVEPAVARLKAAGAKLTPGEILGGRWKSWEDKAMSLPLLGDFISSARKAGQDAFEEIAIDQTLSPIKERVPAGKMGRDAVRFAGDKLAESYQRLTPTLAGQIDPTFVSRVLATRTRANLPEAQAKEFDEIIRREMSAAFDLKTGRIDGRRFKQLEEKLNGLAGSWRKSEDPYVRDLGNAVGDVREHLFALLRRQNPKAADQLRATNRGYRNLVSVENAAGTGEGRVTPGRLDIGNRQADPSGRKRGYKRGTLPMSQLAQDGVDIISNKTPNSFTTDRLLAAGGALGLMGGGAAYFDSPYAALPVLLAAPYMRGGGRKAAEWVLTGRQGAPFKAVRRGLIGSAPVGALAVPPLLARPEN